MKLFPAIDLCSGKVVRLTQGDYKRVDVYDDDPARVAQGFYNAGARHLHVVDLDGAKHGELENYDTIKKIADAVPMFIEVGGGIRDEKRIDKMLAAGASRVILGTAAVSDPGFLARAVDRFGERVALGVDARNGMVATDGWKKTSRIESYSFCENACKIGVKTIIYTDIATDGAMSGTNLPAFERLCSLSCDVIASGGICTLSELSKLRDMGCAGAIVGKALYVGAIKLGDALAVCGGETNDN